MDISMFLSEHILVPFLFVFAVTFGALRLANVFGKEDKHGRSWSGARKVDAIIALALAVFTVSNASFVSMLWSNFGTISMFFIAMFFIIFIMEAFGLRDPHAKSQDKLLTLGAILFFIFSLSMVNTNLFSSIPFMQSSENAFLIISLVFIVILFWLVMKTGKSSGHDG